jgi:hypothetical protein
MATPTEIADLLLLKAATLRKASGLLRASGRDADADAADNEAINCENKAHAIKANAAAITNYPTDAELQQLQNACAGLQTAIDASAAVNGTAAALNQVATAASTARQKVPAANV